MSSYTVTSDSCSLVRFRGWLTAVIPNCTALACGGRKALRMALLATFMKATMACQPLLLYHTWRWNAHISGKCIIDLYLQDFPASDHLYVEFALHISQEWTNISQGKTGVVALKANTHCKNCPWWASGDKTESNLPLWCWTFVPVGGKPSGCLWVPPPEQAAVPRRTNLRIWEKRLTLSIHTNLTEGRIKTQWVVTFARSPSICSSSCEIKIGILFLLAVLCILAQFCAAFAPTWLWWGQGRF